MKPIRVRDLPQAPKYGVSLYCPACRAHYSATRGDYFLADPMTPMSCSYDHEPLRLVRCHTIVEAIAPPDA